MSRSHRLHSIIPTLRLLPVAIILMAAIPATLAQHSFNDVDRWVKRFESPQRARWQKPDEVVAKMNLKPGDVVADIGAGTGYFTRRFARAVGPNGLALGLDIAPNMVKYMKDDARRLGLKNYQARVVKPDDPELPEHSVDVIFMCDTYHHIQNRVKYLRNLQKALKPGGRIIIVDFYKDKDIPVGPPPRIRVSKKQVIGEFAEAGYRLNRDLDFLPYQYFLEFVPTTATPAKSR